MSRVTAKDVARATGVDPSTVSRVLSGSSPSHRYDLHTQRRIRDAASELGYRPSLTARALRTGKTALIGLLVSDIASPFFAELAARIERCAREHRYRLLVGNTDESADQQAEHIGDLVSRGIDGLIVSRSGTAGFDQAVRARVPLVTIDRPLPRRRVAHVGLDDLAAGRMLGEHLRAMGYRRVGVIMPDASGDPGIGRRLRGLRAGLADDGAVDWIIDSVGCSAAESAAADVHRRLSASPLPQAVVGLNYAATLAGLEALGRLSLDVPERIGLTGIDDFATARFLRSPATVISQPIDAIAAEAVAMLLGQMSGKKPNDAVRLLPPTLVKRASLRTLATFVESRI